MYEGVLDLHELLSEGHYKLSVSEDSRKYMIGTGHRPFPCRQASWSANLDSFEVSIVIGRICYCERDSGNSARGFRAPSCSYIDSSVHVVSDKLNPYSACVYLGMRISDVWAAY